MKTTKFSILFSCICLSAFSQIPILNSYPSITDKVIYLDFDGQVVSGTSWNSGNTINALPSTASSTTIRNIWNRVSEDYRPFDVNITTDSVRFNNALPNKRIRVVFTPTHQWYTVPNGGAGGVAYVGSFTWGGTPGTPCWIFETQLGNSSKNMAEAASHEAGHTLTLRHQSKYDASCTKTDEYDPGLGSGVISWAPIMGVGYSRNVTVWQTGKSATSCNTIQYDHNNNSVGITGPNRLNYLTDDVGNFYTTAKILNLNSINLADSGLISTPGDVDAYRFTICNSRYVSINVKPWALDTNNPSGSNTGFNGANLDVKLKLYNAANNLLVGDSTTTRLKALVGMNLAPGSYYFTVDGDGSPNYTDYGSMGKYYISVKATNPPIMANTIVTATNICVAQTTTLGYTSNGTPTNWLWTVTGPTSATFASQNPSLAFSSIGVYTIELLASSGVSASCLSSTTLQVASLPNLVLSNTTPTLCPGKTTLLSASGANSFTWIPGNFTGSGLIVSPTVSATYTVKGSNGTCVNTSTILVTVDPDYTLTLAASNTNICAGTSVTLTAGGANSYSFTGGSTANPLVITPQTSSTYTVDGSNNTCVKHKTITVNVSPQFDIYVTSADSSICVGQTTSIYSSGAINFSIYPGNLTGNQVSVSPIVGTTYTIVGSNSTPCLADTAIFIDAKNCFDTGIESPNVISATSIYPNPFSSQFTIETANSASNLSVKIYNTLGSLVYSKKLTGTTNTIQTKDWARGVYLVTLESQNQKPVTKKMVLE